MERLEQRLAHIPQRGRVLWLGLRPQRRAAMISAFQAEAIAGQGLLGDRYARPKPYAAHVIQRRRQVTLIQGEHLGV